MTIIEFLKHLQQLNDLQELQIESLKKEIELLKIRVQHLSELINGSEDS